MKRKRKKKILLSSLLSVLKKKFKRYKVESFEIGFVDDQFLRNGKTIVIKIIP